MSPKPTRRPFTELVSELSRGKDALLTLMTILDEVPAALAVVEATGEGVCIAYANQPALAVLGGSEGTPAAWRTIDAVARALSARIVELPAAADGQPRALLVGGNSIEIHLRVVSSSWRLTRRQRDVLAHLAKGQSNKAIASELDVAEGTVELHMTALMRKLGVDSRAALIAAFWTHTPDTLKPLGFPQVAHEWHSAYR